MKYNLISLMRAGAEALDAQNDPYGRAFALHEAANNMIELLNGEATLEEIQKFYTAGTAEAIDLDKRFPVDENKEETA